MGKQAFDKRVALANALSTSGKPVELPPKAQKDGSSGQAKGKGKGAGKRKKDTTPEPPPKTKKEVEEEQRKLLEDKELQRKEFYEAEATKKVYERKAADCSVTYVEDKDSRKPVAIDDISEYWRSDLGILPYVPDDIVGPVEVPEGVDVHERLEYLKLLNQQLQQVLKMSFHVFWSQVLYDLSLRRCLDSYLRFTLRAHDVEDNGEAAAPEASTDPVTVEENQLAEEISRRMLSIFLRLSRPEETSHDYISDAKFAEFIYDHHIFDVPKLIDICSVYGDSNRSTVTKIVHSVFMHQPRYKEDFKSVAQHVLESLHQCCSPLQRLMEPSSASQSKGKRDAAAAELSVEECLAFLPDVLTCFNAIFCFFPEECVELLMGGSLETGLPLADVMVTLHESVTALQKRSQAPPEDRLHSVCRTTVSLLSRLLSCVLGFRMAPRKGAGAFDELLEFLKAQVDRSALLDDLGKHGLENVAMDWLASGLVDDAQLDYLEQLTGPLLPKEARARRRKHVSAPSRGSAASSGAAASSSGQSAPAATSDAAKIREVREVVGMDFGEGFVLQCLLHYSNSVPAVVGAILDGSLPPQLAALPTGLGLHQDPSAAVAVAPEKAKLSAEDKTRVMAQAGRMDQDADEAEGGGVREYDDDFDDGDLVPGFNIGGNQGSDSEKSDEEAGSSSEEDEGDKWSGGKGGRKGGGKGKFKGPVQGQTYQARKKEENKAKVANHNRRDRALRKFTMGM